MGQTSFLCFGASQAVSGKGLLFVCDCLASTRASEYNRSLLRSRQMGSSWPWLLGLVRPVDNSGGRSGVEAGMNGRIGCGMARVALTILGMGWEEGAR